MEMEDAKLGEAWDSAGRPVSKLLISSSHAVAKDHHGSFTYEVPNNDQIHCGDPCFVGVSDLQVPGSRRRRDALTSTDHSPPPP